MCRAQEKVSHKSLNMLYGLSNLIPYGVGTITISISWKEIET